MHQLNYCATIAPSIASSTIAPTIASIAAASHSTSATAPRLRRGGGAQSTPAVADVDGDAAAIDAIVGAIVDAIVDAIVAQ